MFENGKICLNSIHLLSPTSTSLDSLKIRENAQLLFLNLLECILDI
jgi:hypothetical protein